MDKINTAVFLKTAETLNFRKTADELGYTQAGVSYIISAMEEELGLPLFIREYGGVKLTSEGRALLPQFRELAAAERLLRDRVDDLKNLDAGEIRVLVFYSISLHWIPEILERFHRDYPNIRVRLISCDETIPAQEMARRREVDCGFFVLPVSDDLEVIPVMDELMNFHDVDIQWGNHDITWMGAAAGSRVCICNVLRIAISYNGFDQLEDGYGINLRPLSMFASEVYGKDPCKRFMPHDLSQNIYDTVDPMLAAKMHKAVTIMQFKLEGQTIRRHPEYHMEHRNFLEQIDYAAGTVMLDGKKRKLQDKNFPTVDPEDPLKLTPAEEELLRTLQTSFTHSERLRRQVDFLYTNGSMYKSCNGNLLYHGCIPMLPDGSFETVDFAGEPASGKQLMDLLEKKVLQASYMEEDTPEKRVMTDLMWYLSCGPKSPLFGRDRITTFECSFVDDKKKTEVVRNPYYALSEREDICKKILDEFEVPGESRHIINGHMLEDPKDGELPIRAGGMLYVIDGGLTRAHRKDLEFAGYALIYNSHHLALAKHKPFDENGGTTPEVTITEEMVQRVMISDTDEGRELEQKISDLKELMEAYRNGTLSEKMR